MPVLNVQGSKRFFGDRSQLKDEFTHESCALYKGYKYSIAIENTQSELYVSEKFTNCIVHGIIPVYLGAHKIDTLFGKDFGVKLSGDLEEDIMIIRHLCSNNTGSNYDAASSLRLILEKSPQVNLFVALENAAAKGKLKDGFAEFPCEKKLPLMEMYHYFQDPMILSGFQVVISNKEYIHFLTKFIPVSDKGFMFTDDPNLSQITNAITTAYPDHSGASLAFTLRLIQKILKSRVENTA